MPTETLAPPGAGRPLLGRDQEVAIVTELVARTSEGRSGALVVHGEAGVGKTALVEHVVATAARDLRTERVVAAESEVELPYAGLHQLCHAMLPRLDCLPPPQADALGAALGLRATSAAPSPFLVSLAVLGLLTEAARDRPLVCVIDDAQWLDAASRAAIAFAARRLGMESVALVVMMRALDEDFAGLQTLGLEGLTDAVADELLTGALPVAIDPRARTQLLADANGNPLALLELSRGWTPSEIAGGYALTDAVPLTLSRRIEASLLAQLAPLPDPARLLLLLAAADPTGDTALLWKAQQHLGLGPDATDAVERSGMVAFGARATFRHPLVRSSVYRAASPEQRRTVHAALAAVSGDGEPDRRAWHAAHAAAEPDEATAAALERSASRARARGGEAAAGAFLERAAQLSPAPSNRARRLLAAARSKVETADPTAAESLLDLIEAEHLTEHEVALRDWLRIRIAFARDRDVAQAALALVAVARRLIAGDPALARSVLDEGLYLSLWTAGFGDRAGPDPRTHARVSAAVLDALPPERPGEDPVDALLRGQALRGVGRREEADPVMRRALAACTRGGHEIRSTTGLASNVALDMWDIGALRSVTAAQVERLRSRGELDHLPNALSFRHTAEMLDGRLDRVDALGAEIDAIKAMLRHLHPRYIEMYVAAWRGDAAGVRRWGQEMAAGALAREDVSALGGKHYAEAILGNALGRFPDAVRAGREELPYAREQSYAKLVLCELVEAAALAGERDVAERALAELSWLTEPLVESDWAQGVLARGRALLAPRSEAEALHRDAIDRLERVRLRLDAARARLTYGGWLRAEHRRADARAELRRAHAELATCGAHGFAARAARELEATGETVRSPAPGVGAKLTAQELELARLARDGMSNREIAARMFLSVRTIEYHLRKVFQKLGIASRRELANVLPRVS